MAKGRINIGASVTVNAKEDGSLKKIEQRIEDMSNADIKIKIGEVNSALKEIEKIENSLGKKAPTSIASKKSELQEELKQLQDIVAARKLDFQEQVKAAELKKKQLKLVPAKNDKGEKIPQTYVSEDGKYRVEKGTVGWNLYQKDARGVEVFVTAYEKLKDIKNDTSLVTNKEAVSQEKVKVATDEATAAIERQTEAIENNNKAKKESKKSDASEVAVHGESAKTYGQGYADGKAESEKAKNALEEANKALNSEIDTLSDENKRLKESLSNTNRTYDRYSATVYHGSKSQLNNVDFDPSKTKGMSNLGAGALYTTPNMEQAIKHGKNLLELQVDLNRAFILTEEHITSISDLYKAMGKEVPKDANWKTIKSDLHSFNGNKENSKLFAQRMKEMGYQGIYSKGYGYLDDSTEQLAIFDDRYLHNLSTVDAKTKTIANQASVAKEEFKDLTEENQSVDTLRQKISAVNQAIDSKTDAFKNEGSVVDTVVASEISALDKLIAKLNDVNSAVDVGSDAFKQDDNVVDTSVKKAKKKSKKTKNNIVEDDKPLQGEQLAMDFDAAEQAANERAAAEAKVNAELAEQIAKEKQLINQRATLKYLDKELNSAQRGSKNKWSDNDKLGYEQVKLEINALLKKKELDADSVDDMRSKVQYYKNLTKEINEQIKAEEKAKKVSGDKKSKGLIDKMGTASSYGAQFKDSDVVQSKLREISLIYDQIKIKQNELTNSTGEVSEKLELEISELLSVFNQKYAELNKIVSASNKSTDKSRFEPVQIDPSVASDVKMLEEAMKKAVRAGEEGRVRFGKFNEELGEMEYQVKETGGQWSHFVARLDSTGTKIIGVNSGLKKTNTLLREIGLSTISKMKSAIGNITGYDLIYRFINVTKQGIQYVREIDSALTELKKVTDETEETYKNFLQTMSHTASVVGGTVADLANSAADWARLGYSLEEAGELAKNTAILMNVSEFENVSDATDSMISALQAFGYAAEDSLHLVDIFNSIGNNFAISTSDLASSLTKSASALVTAGVGIEQASALLTGANTIMQDPDTVSQGLKVIALRIRGVKTELVEMGEETDGVLNTAKLQEKIKGLTGVDIIGDDGGFRNIYDILMDIAKVWDDLDSMSQAAVVEAMAGKNRANVFTSMMVQAETIKEAYEVAMDSEGSAMAENEKYLESIQGHIDQFNNSVQTMWMNFIDSDAVKWFVHAGKAIVDVLDGMSKSIGALPTLIILGATAFAAWKGLPKLFASLFLKLKETTSATEEDTNAKLKNEIQSAKLSKKVKQEALGRVYSKETIEAETAALNENTEAKIRNMTADKVDDVDTPNVDAPNVDVDGDIDIPNIDIDNNKSNDFEDYTWDYLAPSLDDAADSFDNVKNSGEAAKEVIGDAGKEAVEAATKTTVAGEAAEGAGKAVTSLGAKIKALWASPFAGAAIAIGILAAVAIAVDIATTSFKEAKEQLSETTEELNLTRSELESLDKEFKTINDRIDELNSKGNLSLTEAEELKNLQAQSDELDRQIKLAKQREKILQRQAVEDAKVLAERDQRITGSITPEAGAYVGGGAGAYKAPTTTIDNNINKKNAANEKLNEENGIYKKLTDAYNEYEEAQENGTKAEIRRAKRKYENLVKEKDAQEKIVEDAQNNLIDSATELAADYAGLEWQYGDPEELENWQKENNAILKEVYDAQDRALIESAETAAEASKATMAAFQRIDSQTFSNIKNESGEVVSAAEMIQSTVGITGEELYNMLNTDTSIPPENLAVLQSFVQSLIDVGVIADAESESLQKVVDLSIMMSESTSEAAIANKELARSQKRLQYYKLYKELNKYTKMLADGRRRTRELSAADKEAVKVIREKMAALAAEISAYDVLGAKIEEAKAAFDNFESAQTADSESDRLESAGEMFKAIIDGFHSAELGSETFKAAMAGLVPTSVYEDLDTLEEKYDAVWKYMNEDLNKYFTLEYDDDGLVESVETTTADVERFLNDAKDKGLMSLSDNIWTVEETDFSKFAEAIGITESALYALAVQMDKIDADWIMGDISTFLESFDMGTESNIYKTITSLADLDQQLIDGKITLSEYNQQYNELQDSLKEESANALDDIVAYNEASAKVDEYTEKVGKARVKLEELLSNPTASDEEVQKATNNLTSLTTFLGEAIQQKGKLTAPSEMVITFAQDSLIAQMESVKTQLLAQGITIPLILESGEINDELFTKDLETGEYTVAVTPTVEGLSQEGQNLLQSYADLLNAEGSLNIFIEGEEDAQAKLDTIKTEAEAITEAIETIPDPEINTTAAQSNVNTLKAAVDRLKQALEDIPRNVTTTVTKIEKTVSEGDQSPRRNSFGLPVYNGTANAQGNWGAEKTETALVGELGSEIRVRGSHWELIGQNGAEFTDVRKGDIIFNHKQTEEILKNGHINSRGKAFVGGTAYNGNSLTLFDKYSNTAAFGNSGSGLDDALSDIDDDFEELFDWFEVLVEEIDEQVSLMEAQLENAVGIDSKKSIYSGLISAEYNRLDKLTKGIELYKKQAEKFLAEIPAKYKDMAKDGAVQITAFKGEVNEKVVEAINNYREWAQKAADLNQQLEETKAHISELRVESHNMIVDEYERDIKLITNLNDTLEAEMGLLEEKGERSSANFYEEMIKNSSNQLELLRQEREKLQADLDEGVKSGDIEKDSPAWHEMVNNIYEVDAAIIETQTSIESFNNSIQELHWENFEKIMDEISAVSDEAEQLRDLIGDDNLTEELIPEQWTADGLTALGLIAQQMENAKFSSEKYAAEIEYLNKEFEAGNYSQDEYNEKLKEFKDGQWDAIDAYESAKKAIVDLNKTRVDAIKDGIQKEIDAYEELINKRKEDLNSQKDAHDWAKTVADHTENIDAIQRQIDAMAGDNSAAAIAQRKKLQEQLKEAQEEYDEALYDRSIETQQNSLDKSLETYREEQEGKMEELDAWLENEEQVIAESYEIISANTEAIHSNIEAISDKYGIEIENNVVDPWTAGINALGTYGTELDTATSKYVEMLGAVRQELADLQLQADETAASIIETTNAKNKSTQAAEKDPPKEEPKPATTTSKKPSGGYSGGSSSSVSVGQNVTVSSNATNFAKDGGNGTKMQSWVPGSSFTVMETNGNQVLIGINGQATGWVNKEDVIPGYAKGTTGVKSNQLAWVDENGLEEIVMHANNGRLEYLTKGSTVIPHDITENLMELGKVDPKTWLANNRKTSVPVSITTNNNVIDLSFGSMINIEHADRDSIPEIKDAVKRQMDAYMKNINTGLKKYTR